MDVTVSGAKVYGVIPVFGGIRITQTTLSLVLVTLFLCTAFVLLHP